MAKNSILIIGPCYPYRGGNSLFISYLFDALKKEFDVEIVNYKLLYPSLLFPGTTQLDKSDEHFMEVPSKRMLSSISPASWVKTANYIKNRNPDLVVFDWWQPFFGPCHRVVSSLIRNQFKNRILFITENVISHEARFVDRFLTHTGLKHADRFLALSQQVVSDLQSFRKKEQPIYRSELPVFGWFKKQEDLNIEAEKEKLGFERNDTVLMFFGYVRKYKGLDILLDAFAQLALQNPNFKLLVAGEFYDNPQIYMAQIEKLGIKDKVKVINQFVPNEEVARYFQLSELVVQPYRSATQSGILNIAYGYQKPVVVTRVGGLEEFVDHEKTGIIVDKATPEHISAGIKHYFSIKDEVNFPEFIRKRVQGNSFQKITEVFKKIMQDALQ